jgi:hypothetical protein
MHGVELRCSALRVLEQVAIRFLAEVRTKVEPTSPGNLADWFRCCVVAAKRLLHGLPGLLGLNAAGDSIEDGQPCLLNRRDGIIDRETRLPLQSLGIVFGAPELYLSLSLGNSGLQSFDVGRNFRF